MELDELRAGLAETAIGLGQASPAQQVGTGEGAQAGFATLAPREGGGGVEGALRVAQWQEGLPQRVFNR